MRMGMLSAVVVAVIAGTMTVAAPPALAQEPDPVVLGNATGGGWAEGVEAPDTRRELADARARKELWAGYLSMNRGTSTAAAFRRLEARVGRQLGLDLRRDRLDSLRELATCRKEPCKRVVLDVRHRGQVTSYHCGPATGAMIAAFLNRPRSAYNGIRLTQFNLGGNAHMGTNRNQVTAYASKRFTKGLNRWVDGRPRGRFSQVDAPSVRAFTGSSTYNITSGRPYAVGTVELEGERSYNGHDTSTEAVGHWVVARGFARFGKVTYLLDPATTVWRTTEPRFDQRTRPFVSAFVDNGISA